MSDGLTTLDELELGVRAMSFRRRLQACFVVLGMGTVGSLVWACGGYSVLDQTETPVLIAELGDLARHAGVAGKESPKFDNIVETLRARRQPALDAAINYRNERLEAFGGLEFAEIENLDLAIDKIAGQKFASQSRLYWHTSLGIAKVDSRKTNRPILSLRMLGRLDEDLSCANSRFFRTTLYPDPEIAALLREHFVLHWQSVRDVPVVTIDFGDGRQLNQPLTGNSVHLVVDSGGRPFDALPGLVSPQAFKQWLSSVDQLWNDSDRGNDAAFWSSVADFHRKRAAKRRADSSLAISTTQPVSDLNPLDERWSQLAASEDVRLASTSRQLLQAQRPGLGAEAAMVIAPSKAIVETPMLRLVQPIEPLIARDTVFNLYALQTRIDDWFTQASVPATYDDLTKRIYAEAFQMPLDDPWLGLSPDTFYTALDNGGRVDVTARSGKSALPLTQIALPRMSPARLDSKLPH
jgi:hypothetical protein